MPFDPLSWALGYVLSKAADKALKRTAQGDLTKELRKDALEWASELPAGLQGLNAQIVPRTLFSHLQTSEDEIVPKQKVLADAIREKKIPSQSLWVDALFERWQEVRKTLDETVHPFFQTDPSTVRPLLDNLAKKLEKVCTSNEELFRQTTYELLQEMRERIDHIADHAPRIPNIDYRTYLRSIQDKYER